MDALEGVSGFGWLNLTLSKNRNMLAHLVRRTQVTRVKQLLRPVAASFHSTPTACDAAPKDNKIGSQLEVKRTNRRPTNPVVFCNFFIGCLIQQFD